MKNKIDMVLDKPLTNLQLELLKLYSMELSEEQLQDVKRLLANYFAKQASDEMDRLWEERGWDDETMEAWLSDEKRPGEGQDGGAKSGAHARGAEQTPEGKGNRRYQ